MKDGEEDEKGCGGKAGPKGSLGLAPMMIWFLFYWKCFTIPYCHQVKAYCDAERSHLTGDGSN